MLDVKFVRDHPDVVRKALRDRGMDFDMDALLADEERYRTKLKDVEELRAQQNKAAERIAGMAASERAAVIVESRAVKERLRHAEDELKILSAKLNAEMIMLPNIPDPDAPVGSGERDNIVLREVGEKRVFGFTPRDYMDIATQLGLIDTERAAKVSGSRFGYLLREAALMEMALVRYAWERLASRGFTPVTPPVMVREWAMEGMGYADTAEDREEKYFFAKDGLYLVGTSEQSVVPMHAETLFDPADLPRRYVAFSTCFRREAGSYGKDTRGILRVHQFDKVEMVSFTRPEDSRKEHELFIAAEEELMQGIGLPYRVVALSTGDIARPSARTVDIEAWLPGQNGGAGEYRETHSSSNTTDFQARRLDIRYRSEGARWDYVHILNGTAFAVGRTLIAILENYQRADGSVAIPSALRPYMGGMTEIRR